MIIIFCIFHHTPSDNAVIFYMSFFKLLNLMKLKKNNNVSKHFYTANLGQLNYKTV